MKKIPSIKIDDSDFKEKSLVKVVGSSSSKDTSFNKDRIGQTGVVLSVNMQGLCCQVKIIKVRFSDGLSDDFLPSEVVLSLF